MELHELPYELLVRVACFLDVESLIAFGKTNSRMEDVTLDALKSVTVKTPSETVIEYLRQHGPLVRSMDLSHCEFSFGRLLKSVADCRHLKQLNLVNSAVPHEDLLCILRLLTELEALSFTMEVFDDENDPEFESLGPFRCIKKLYVEIGPDFLACEVLIDLLNECEAIESVHVNFIGDHVYDRSVIMPPLDAERWETLHTFICACWLAYQGEGMKMFLRSIFTHKTSSECTRWIEEDRDCYIYERGFFNSKAADNVSTSDFPKDVEILRKYQVVKMAEDGEQPLKIPWGKPWSLRIIGFKDWASELSRTSLLGTLSTQLRELDLREVHGGYSEEFRLSLLTSAPNLSVLGLPACFFVPSTADPEETRLLHLTEALQRMKLRKFFLRSGGSHESSTKKCSVCATKLTSSNLSNLTGLSCLEELTLSLVALENSAFEILWNRNLRTIRLHAIETDDLSFLRSFVSQCPKLRNFKMKAFNLAADYEQLAEALVEAVNLRQLCLEPGSCDALSTARLAVMLPDLPESLEVIHFHIRSDEDDNAVMDELAMLVHELGETRGKEIFYDDQVPSLTYIQCTAMVQSVPGRGLCCQQANNSVGYVKPFGWEAE